MEAGLEPVGGETLWQQRVLAAAWKNELKETEDTVTQSVDLPDKLQGGGLRSRDCIAFLADTEPTW